MKVGEYTCDNGEKVYGKLKVTELADGSAVEVPLILVNGEAEGPTLYTQSACHGVEINGTEAIRRISQNLDPAAMAGTFIAIPIVNMLAARHRLTKTPEELDYTFGNMNRAWPGDPEGTITERMAYVICEEAVKKADFVLDHHTGSMPTVNWIYYYKGAKEQRNLAEVYGTKYLIAEEAGTERWEKKRYSGKLRVVCHEQLDIPAICPELDGRDHIDEDAVEIGIRGMTNVMNHLGMLQGEIERPRKQYLLSNTEMGHVKADKGGWFLPEVEIGEEVNEGQTIGRILSILDGFKEKDVLESPRDGIVQSLNGFPMVWPGTRVASVDKIMEEIRN